MLLYHGTSARHVDTIVKNGILPRSATGNSNWEKYESRPDMIYLSTAYPLYFAATAMETGENLAAIFEIDSRRLDVDKFYPDEDFVAQAISHRENRPIEDIHEGIKKDLESYRHTWGLSVAGLGNCAYRGAIPVEAITRYATIDAKKRPELYISMTDPSISLINFQVLGSYYKDFVSWVMGDRKLLPQLIRSRNEQKMFTMAAKLPNAQVGPKGMDMGDYTKKRVDFWKKESKIRDGIEVVDLRKKVTA